MVRDTSLETYYQIESEGLLSIERTRVLKGVFEFGPGTSGEIYKAMGIAHPRNALSQSRARFTELRDRGVIREVAKRACHVSGRPGIVWEATGLLPVEPDEKPKRFTKLDAKRVLEIASTMKSASDRSLLFDIANILPGKAR